MNRTFIALICVGFPLFAGAASAEVGSTAVEHAGLEVSDADNLNNWREYSKHEEKALSDYWWRLSGPDVIDNGRKLRDISRSPAFGQAHPSCGEAALTLSHMVTGQYFSSRRHSISSDWFSMAESYVSRRKDCIAALRVDLRDYPLPGWFGR